MFNRKKISGLEDQVRVLKSQIIKLRLDYLTTNGKYKFKVSQEIEILEGKFKIQNRGYSDRSIIERSGAYERFVENFVPCYCIVGVDNEDVLYLEEKKLMCRIAECKSINERINY